MWYIWLIASGIFFTIEIATVGFLVFWLGIAALIAMVVSFFTSSLLIQTVVFVVSSSILLVFTKPIVDKYISKPGKPTNSSSLINKHGIVTADIDTIQGKGLVKVNNQIWSAKCSKGTTIPEGTEVEVIKIEGVKLVVSSIN